LASAAAAKRQVALEKAAAASKARAAAAKKTSSTATTTTAPKTSASDIARNTMQFLTRMYIDEYQETDGSMAAASLQVRLCTSCVFIIIIMQCVYIARLVCFYYADAVCVRSVCILTRLFIDENQETDGSMAAASVQVRYC
jgi:hypothetical protein